MRPRGRPSSHMEPKSESSAGSRFQRPARLGVPAESSGARRYPSLPVGTPGAAQGGAGLPGPRHRRKAKARG